VATTFFGGEPYGSSDSYVQGSDSRKGISGNELKKNRLGAREPRCKFGAK
jgi:hypothetical protein